MREGGAFFRIEDVRALGAGYSGTPPTGISRHISPWGALELVLEICDGIFPHSGLAGGDVGRMGDHDPRHPLGLLRLNAIPGIPSARFGNGRFSQRCDNCSQS